MIIKVIRPVTSRTKLLFHNSFASPESNSSSASELSIKSGETERCGPIKHKKSVPKKFLTSQLETIPGSRSASPANALRGPFSGHWNTPVESPMPQPSSPTGSFAVAVSRTPSRQRRDPDQSYIHPLFRSESPTPPSIASPGTVITASPHAGQVVSPEQRPFSPCRWHSGGEPQAWSAMAGIGGNAVDVDATEANECPQMNSL